LLIASWCFLLVFALGADHVLAHIDTDSSRGLVKNRLAYVSVSRATEDARIYTNSADTLGERLASDVSKTAAVNLQKNGSSEQKLPSTVTSKGTMKTPGFERESYGISL
jgi:hypothetical protein